MRVCYTSTEAYRAHQAAVESVRVLVFEQDWLGHWIRRVYLRTPDGGLYPLPSELAND